ncbi:MAG: hypothetical protein C4522_03565 [Desulfobacteraceae bacterium]|nr:MAG: hypothetical protein C4522_03565 [Desulfobacteraceae bacterium]
MKTTHYIRTLVPVAILLAFALQKGNGFLIVLLLPFFLMYLVYHAVCMIRRSGERKSRGIRMIIWSVVLVLAGIVQTYWSVCTRSEADRALQKVLAFKERAGIYPASLREAGLDDTEWQEKWKLRYSVKDGKPILVYPSSVMPLTMHEYDFETLAWRKNVY